MVGKEGEEIWTDKYGRVKVQFHWDRYGKSDEKSSCWVRVSHPWAGKDWGAVAIPRIGQEVIVDFLEGDPDQPIITGRVYNGANMPPYGLPAGAVISGLKSNSTKGGGGYNEYVMDDTKGNELIREHGQFDKDSTIEHDLREQVGNDRSATIGNDEKLTVDANRTTHVKGNFNETIDGSEIRTVSTGVTEKIDAGEKRTITGGVTESITGGETRTINGNQKETVTGAVSQTVTGGVKITTPGTFEVTAQGGSKIIAPAGHTVIAPGGQTQVDSFWEWLGGAWKWMGGTMDSYGVKTASAYAFKTQFEDISLGVTGFKADYVHMLACKNGVELGKKSTE